MTNKGITILLGDDDSQMTNKLSREFASGFEALGFSTHQVIASSLFSFNKLISGGGPSLMEKFS